MQLGGDLSGLTHCNGNELPRAVCNLKAFYDGLSSQSSCFGGFLEGSGLCRKIEKCC